MTGPVIGTVAPAFIHAVHGIAALFVTVGLYGLLRGEFGGAAEFEGLFGG